MPTHLFAAQLGLFTALAFSLYMAIVPLHRWFNERAAAHRLLGEALQAIQAKLPPAAASEAEIRIGMPLHPHPLLRKGFRYYPERQAYKYTFEPRWSRHGVGSHYQKLDDFPPEPLERRSIWFQARNGQWHCHAGIKNGVLGALPCKDSSIVQGLSVKEHHSALRINDCAHLAFAVNEWKLPAQTHFVDIRDLEASHAHIYLHNPGKDVVIMADSSKQKGKARRFFYTPETRIIGLIWLGKHWDDLYGLPDHIPVLNYGQAFHACHQEATSIYSSDIKAQLMDEHRSFDSLDKARNTPDTLATQYNTLEQVPADAWQSAPTLLQDGVFKSVPTP